MHGIIKRYILHGNFLIKIKMRKIFILLIMFTIFLLPIINANSVWSMEANADYWGGIGQTASGDLGGNALLVSRQISQQFQTELIIQVARLTVRILPQ